MIVASVVVVFISVTNPLAALAFVDQEPVPVYVVPVAVPLIAVVGNLHVVL